MACKALVFGVVFCAAGLMSGLSVSAAGHRKLSVQPAVYRPAHAAVHTAQWNARGAAPVQQVSWPYPYYAGWRGGYYRPYGYGYYGGYRPYYSYSYYPGYSYAYRPWGYYGGWGSYYYPRYYSGFRHGRAGKKPRGPGFQLLQDTLEGTDRSWSNRTIYHSSNEKM